MADAPSNDASGAAILKQKIFGLPIWAVGLVLGGTGLIAYYFISKKNAAAASAANAANAQAGLAQNAASDASSLYPIAPVTYVTGVQQPSATPTSPNTAAGTPPTPLWQFGWQTPPQGQYVWHLTSSGYQQNPAYPQGQVYPGSNTARPGQNESWMWSPIPQGTDPNGNPWTAQSYAQALSASGLGGGGFAGGLQSDLTDTTPWQSMAQQHRPMGYWSGLGGRGGSVEDAAKVHGTPVERLKALNPFHDGGLVRVA